MSDHSVASTGGCSYQGQQNLQLNLSGFLAAVSRRWVFVLVTSTAAALIVGGITFFGARRCQVTYSYGSSGRLDARNHEIFLYRFYSAENISRLVKRLRSQGVKRCAQALEDASMSDRADIQKIINVTVWPKYTGVSGGTPLDAAEAEAMRKITPDLLIVTITGPYLPEFDRLVSIVRENIEAIMPMYLVRQENKGFAREQRAKIATLRADCRMTEMALEMNNDILAGLKNIPPHKTARSTDGLTVQFAVAGGNVEHLPIPYQIQTAEAGVTRLIAKQTTNRKRLAYREKLLALADRLLAEVNGQDADTYSILDYEKYLIGQREAMKKAAGGKDSDTLDYITAHLDGIQSKISSLAPTVEQPQIVRIPKGTVSRTIITFCIALAVCVLLVNIQARRRAVCA